LLNIAVTCVNSAQLALLKSGSHGRRLSSRAEPGSPDWLAAGDFLGTGKISLAVSSSSTGSVNVVATVHRLKRVQQSRVTREKSEQRRSR
jgi:hypothetical protein